MKRKLALILVLVFVMALLPACGQQAAPAGQEAPAAEAPAAEAPAAAAPEAASNSGERQKVVIWTNLTAEAQMNILQKQFSEIGEELGVDVEVDAIALSDLYTKMATGKETGDIPDLMQTAEASIAYLQQQDLLLPVDDIIDELGKDDFMQSALDMCTKDGHVWGIPDWVLHTSVWYNKAMFAEQGIEVPTSWDEFREAAKKLTVDTDNDGQIDVYGFPVPMSPTLVATQTFYPFLCSEGMTILDPKTGEYLFDKNIDAEIEIMDYIIDLYKEASPPDALSWAWSDYRNGLVEGNVAMTLDMGAVVKIAMENNPDMVQNLGCFDLPAKNGPAAANFGGTYNMLATKQDDPAKEELAKEFLRRLYVPERTAERALSRPLFAFPSQNSAFEIYKENEDVKVFEAEMNYIYGSLRDSAWYAYGMEDGLNQLNTSMQATTFFGEEMQGVALGSQTSAAAIKAIDEGLKEQIELINES